MTLTNGQMQREIVSHLLGRSHHERWKNSGLDAYLEFVRWEILEYKQNDYGPDGDTNIRIFGIKGASADDKLSGRVSVTTDHSDEQFIKIDAIMPEGKLTSGQHDFIALARGEAAWLMDVAEPKSTHPDFGSW